MIWRVAAITMRRQHGGGDSVASFKMEYVPTRHGPYELAVRRGADVLFRASGVLVRSMRRETTVVGATGDARTTTEEERWEVAGMLARDRLRGVAHVLVERAIREQLALEAEFANEAGRIVKPCTIRAVAISPCLPTPLAFGDIKGIHVQGEGPFAREARQRGGPGEG